MKRRLRDCLNELIFRACKIESPDGIVIMYKACTEMSQGSVMRCLCIKTFFEKLVGSRNIEILKKLVFDNQTDVSSVL